MKKVAKSGLDHAFKIARPLSEAVETFKEIQAKMRFLESELKTARDTIMQAVENAPDGKIVTEEWSITLCEFEAPYFDKKAAFEKHGKLLEKFVSTRPQQRLTVK